jgi:NTE family protein
MGAIIGSSLAIGLTTEEILKNIEKFSSLKKWIKFSIKGNSLIKNNKIKKILFEIFENKKIKDVNIPLKIISTNLKNGNSKTFRKNDDITIVDAILASMAIPGVFEEQKIKNNFYVDGFLSQNLEILEASSSSIIAIDVLGFNSFKANLPTSFIKTKNIFEMIEKSMRILIINQTKNNIQKLKDKNLKYFDLNTNKFKTFNFNKYQELYNLEHEESKYEK